MALVVLGLGLGAAPAASGEGARDAAGAPSPFASRGVHVSKKKATKKPRRNKAVVPAVHTRSRLTLAASAGAPSEPLVDESALPPVVNGSCPGEMALIEQRYCVDRYEASLVEVLATGEAAYSPYEPVLGHDVRAVSVAGVFPQAYVSGVDAARACGRSGKRLCKPAEWRKACAGPREETYGYADRRERGRCNDAGRSPMVELFHLSTEPTADATRTDRNKWDPLRMNDPRLNQLAGGLARTGSHPDCTNGYGVLDMVGNLHEWVDDPDGTFQGGYYLDVTLNGEGCAYRTRAHDVGYHDYSTGFRCCADPAP